ncbi:endonuclease/exonuclease/phosphatase family protein [Snuella lapsa]|uniref:Endonuclease/exonuclease/phosphatase domain-containing protein n=1 Tax=Snuella lapsa TaxID=870481 RepID=A0ABP6Y326_9FLAO
MNHKFYSLLLVLIFNVSFGYSQKDVSTLKVMTYNIWNGFDWGKDTERKAAWTAWINEKDPDVLALQELCGYDEEKLKADAKTWGHPYVKILKSKGYPVGITSKQPITLKQSILEGFWHGMLHCETFGTDFFVVHLSPADSDFRLKEAYNIADRITLHGGDNYVILGDFNAHSPFDESLLKQNKTLLEQYQDSKDAKYSNLRLGAYDYAVISHFISLPAIDVTKDFVSIDERYTFPTPILVSPDRSREKIDQQKQRIDYIFTSPILSKSCVKVEVFNSGAPEKLSDHYPLMATFQMENP